MLYNFKSPRLWWRPKRIIFLLFTADSVGPMRLIFPFLVLMERVKVDFNLHQMELTFSKI